MGEACFPHKTFRVNIYLIHSGFASYKSMVYTKHMNIIEKLLGLKKPKNSPPNLPLPKALTSKYSFNEKAFDNFIAKLRDHQKDALQATKTAYRGQVSIPTGTGKTYIQVAIHIKDMLEKSKQGRTGVYVISAHRLLLCSQLQDDFAELAWEVGLPIDILRVNSERFDIENTISRFKQERRDSENFSALNKIVTDATQTTSPDEVLEAYNRASANGKHLLVVVTYHSFDRLHKLPNIDVVTYDEAHIIDKDFRANIAMVKPNIQQEFFFTATRKVIGENEGMNDIGFFGDILYSESPRTMIDRGEIVAPMVQGLLVPENAIGNFENMKMVVRAIVDGFVKHHSMVKKHSSNPDAIGAKLLVSLSGNLELSEILKDEQFKKWCEENKVHMFSFSSDLDNGYRYNFQPVTRLKAFETMQKLHDTDNAIFLHIDILAEGIDLPSITGIMPLRSLTDMKLTQTIGRATRLFPEDRKKLYNGTIKADEKNKYVKPWCWVILPYFMKNIESNSMEKFLRKILNTYELHPYDIGKYDEFLSMPDDVLDRMTPKDTVNRKEDITSLQHIIKKIMLEDFEIALNNASDNEVEKFVEGLQDNA